MPLRIRALSVGRIFGLPAPAMTYMSGWGDTVDIPLIMFVIEGGEFPIVVDTGADPERAARIHGVRMDRSDSENPVRALAEIGVDADDVRIVVNTHLHWDHSSNNDLFPSARVVVQRAEVEFARDPVPWHRGTFEKFPDRAASWQKAEDRVQTVDGDVEIAPGVALVALPGHTPGSQGVLVETDSQRYLIAGDTLYTYNHWAGDADTEHLAVGIYTDLVAYRDSLRKIETLDCEIIPSHDDRVIARAVFA